MNTTTLHVKSVIVPDPSVRPANENHLVMRYCLATDDGWVVFGGCWFGNLRNMLNTNGGSSDCRHYLRETRERAMLDWVCPHIGELPREAIYHG